jgi:hypothetical protein
MVFAAFMAITSGVQRANGGAESFVEAVQKRKFNTDLFWPYNLLS